MQGIKESHQDKIDYYNKMVRYLNRTIQNLQNKIDAMYMDKLDKKITEEFWKRNHEKLLNDKENATIKLQALGKSDINFFKNAEIIIELSRKAHSLFLKQDKTEKKKMIRLIVSESVYRNNRLGVKLQAPFDKVLLSQKTGNMLPR